MRRANIDGTNIEDLSEPGIGAVEDIAIDLENQKMYWAEWVRIRRADLDGSNLETLVTGLTRADGIDLDLENGKIYWTERGTHKIQRSNLDGSNVEDIVDSPVPESIGLDVENGLMYWTDWQDGNEKIYRANLDGSGKEVIVETNLLGRPFGIDLDLSNQKMYWTDDENGTISRANLDGTGIETLVDGLNKAIDVSLDLPNGKMYWIQTQENKISRSNLDGSEIEELITSNLSFPTGIALLLEENTATKENTDTVRFEIKPNPSNGHFTVESGKKIKSISVFGMDGEFLFDKYVDFYEANIEMHDYPKGVYLLKIDFETQVIKSEKIIIK